IDSRNFKVMLPDLDNPQVKIIIDLLQTHLERDYQERQIPGLSVALVYDQSILWSRGFGYADLGRQILADTQTVYRIGSITKVFIATMLMQLRDAGKL